MLLCLCVTLVLCSQLKVQAAKIAAEQGIVDFKPTNGWFARFQTRFGFVHLNLHGEGVRGSSC